MMQAPRPFWKITPLPCMTKAEWESLCDGCAKCCLQKLEDEETKEIYYTNIACDLLDPKSCRCTRYQKRSVLVPTCVTLTPAHLEDPYWLPPTCAYRLLAEGKDLPEWHPLISGDPNSVVLAGHSVLGRSVPEAVADRWEHHLIDWI